MYFKLDNPMTPKKVPLLNYEDYAYTQASLTLLRAFMEAQTCEDSRQGDPSQTAGTARRQRRRRRSADQRLPVPFEPWCVDFPHGAAYAYGGIR